MPMEFGLKLMSAISANCVNAKRKLFYNIVDELTGVRLVMSRIDF